MATRDNSNVVVRPEPDRTQAKSLVINALTAVNRSLKAGTVDERQELYADLGMDSLASLNCSSSSRSGSTSPW